jgi:hypothetical protein
MPVPTTPTLKTAKPNAYTSNEMWAFVEGLEALEPSTVHAGVFANKPGYHNTRRILLSQGRTGDYSIQLAADKLGSDTLAAAVDWTFPEAQRGSYTKIDKYSSRLLASGLDPNDERGNYLREFYGQADADTAVEGWDFQRLALVTSNSSHLWHIHFSFLRKYTQTWKAFDAVLSILRGEPVANWRMRWGVAGAKPVPYVPTLRRAWPSYMPAGHYFGLLTGPAASHGGFYLKERPDVKAIQQRLIRLGYVPGVTSVLSGWADGRYEQATKNAVTNWQRAKYAAYTSRFGEVWKDDWKRLFTY